MTWIGSGPPSVVELARVDCNNIMIVRQVVHPHNNDKKPSVWRCPACERVEVRKMGEFNFICPFSRKKQNKSICPFFHHHLKKRALNLFFRNREDISRKIKQGTIGNAVCRDLIVFRVLFVWKKRNNVWAVRLFLHDSGALHLHKILSPCSAVSARPPN